jgi:hypothetical protein
MATRPIKITGSNATTGSLTLDDLGHTRADAGDMILWQIANQSNVHSIVAITEKKASPNFWSTSPRAQGANWQGNISSTARVGDRYVYSIHWRASEDGPVLTHDPILSIKPSVQRLQTIILIVLIAVVGILTFGLLRSDRNE